MIAQNFDEFFKRGIFRAQPKATLASARAIKKVKIVHAM